MQRVLLTIATAGALVALAWVPATGAQTTIVDLALGSSLSADFNDGEQGWSKSPVNVRPPPTSSWEWGAPTSGPGAAASGSNVWATTLAGDYVANQCSGLMSPPIALPADSFATVSFNHWRHFELFSPTSTAWDGGIIMVTTDGGDTLTIVSATGYGTQSHGTAVRTCWDGAPTSVRGYSGPSGTTLPPPDYASDSADISAFAGQTVQVVFAFASDGSGHRAGWYLDDFTVTVNEVATVQDFEASDGGFTMISTKAPTVNDLGWEHGTATVGPAHDSPLFATNLAGDHGREECAWIESPAFLVGPAEVDAGAVVTTTLSWKQFFRSSSSGGAGVVQVGTADGYVAIEPTTEYNDDTVTSSLLGCLGADAATTGVFSGTTLNPLDTPLVDQEADLTPWAGQTITIRFLFASTTSTLTYEGWYVDDVNVDSRLVASVPDPEDLVTVPKVPSAPEFGEPIPGLDGWTSGGTNNTWAYGVTTSNPIGHTVLKTNLGGTHHRLECSFVETPAIQGFSIADDPTLRFEHWHRIPGTSVNVPWAAGIVLVSSDGGLTWSHLAMGDYNKNIYEPPIYTEIYDNCLAKWGADSSGGGYGKASTSVPGNVGGFYTSSADLTAYLAAPALKFRFAYASDGTFDYEGWALRSVEVGSHKLL